MSQTLVPASTYNAPAMTAPKVEVVHDHRPSLLPVPSAVLQHRCCSGQDAVPAEFAMIAAEVLDCFATSFYAAPIAVRDIGQLRFECALVIDEDDGGLRLRLRAAVEAPDGRPHTIAIQTAAIVFIMGALRTATIYKQLEVSPVMCTDDLTCEFTCAYPGVLRTADIPGLGDKNGTGERCWPTSLLHAPLPDPHLALRARSIVDWLRSGPDAKVH